MALGRRFSNPNEGKQGRQHFAAKVNRVAIASPAPGLRVSLLPVPPTPGVFHSEAAPPPPSPFRIWQSARPTQLSACNTSVGSPSCRPQAQARQSRGRRDLLCWLGRRAVANGGSRLWPLQRNSFSRAVFRAHDREPQAKARWTSNVQPSRSKWKASAQAPKALGRVTARAAAAARHGPAGRRRSAPWSRIHRAEARRGGRSRM
jgi:hypothetical protein